MSLFRCHSCVMFMSRSQRFPKIFGKWYSINKSIMTNVIGVDIPLIFISTVSIFIDVTGVLLAIWRINEVISRADNFNNCQIRLLMTFTPNPWWTRALINSRYLSWILMTTTLKSMITELISMTFKVVCVKGCESHCYKYSQSLWLSCSNLAEVILMFALFRMCDFSKSEVICSYFSQVPFKFVLDLFSVPMWIWDLTHWIDS